MTQTLSASLPPTPNWVTSSPTLPTGGAWTLNQGDLCIWSGKQTETSFLKNRVIYQVMSRDDETDKYGNHIRLTLRVAFDLASPVGTVIAVHSWSTHELRKISLIDVGIIRLSLDNFIREYARQRGMDVTDVTDGTET
jgi:hypothetical protein